MKSIHRIQYYTVDKAVLNEFLYSIVFVCVCVLCMNFVLFSVVFGEIFFRSHNSRSAVRKCLIQYLIYPIFCGMGKTHFVKH